MKKSLSTIANLILILTMLFMTGCSGLSFSGDAEMVKDICIYYPSKDGMSLERENVPANAAVPADEIGWLISELQKTPENINLKRVLGDDVSLLKYELHEGQLLMYFDEAYNFMEKTDEVLFRSSIVKTMCQAKDVEGVSFFVEDKPVMNTEGELVGVMTADTFVDTSMDSMGNYDRTEVNLYFAAADGKTLSVEKRVVVYPTNVALEKMILEQLIAGPKESGYLPTLSSDRKINSITVKEGICYVDLTEPMIDVTQFVAENISVYSIVDSLTELDYINKVQISVDGNQKRTLRGTMNLDMVYERNLDVTENVTGNVTE